MSDPRQQNLLNTASRLRQEGRIAEAIEAYRNLLEQFPELPDSWYNLAWLLRQARQGEAALEAYGEALRRGVKEPAEVHVNRAAILSDLGNYPESEAELRRGLEADPGYLPAHINLGRLFEDLGERAKASAAYTSALDIQPDSAVALSRLAGLAGSAASDDALVARIRTLLAAGRLPPADAALLRFALGRLLDLAGDYSEAASEFTAANEAARVAAAGNVAPYDGVTEMLRTDRVAAAFAAAGERRTGIASPEPQPVFILGMFRSGSTLVEQILSAHSAIRAGGELDMIGRIARGLGGDPARIANAPDEALETYAKAYLEGLNRMFPGARMITDKRPDNFWHIGLIKRLFPDARIINTLRHPLDNLISVWALYLDASMNYSFRLQDIAAHIHAERRMMAYWKQLFPENILTVNYESLIAEPEAEISRMLDFIGLPFEAGCLEFHKSGGPVRTASAWQVREPLHTRSIGRWRHYRDFLARLADDAALKSLLAVEHEGKPA